MSANSHNFGETKVFVKRFLFVKDYLNILKLLNGQKTDSSFQISEFVEAILKLNQELPDKFYSLIILFDLFSNKPNILNISLILQILIYKILKILLYFMKNYNFDNFYFINFLISYYNEKIHPKDLIYIEKIKYFIKNLEKIYPKATQFTIEKNKPENQILNNGNFQILKSNSITKSLFWFSDKKTKEDFEIKM